MSGGGGLRVGVEGRLEGGEGGSQRDAAGEREGKWLPPTFKTPRSAIVCID